LKWWFRKCFRFNSCQVWIWFKCDWWKWKTIWKTVWSKNFNIVWNQNWLKWWFIKCFRFNSCQSWIWFKDNQFNLSMHFNKDNRIRNPDTQNLRTTRCSRCESNDWRNSHSNSTLIEFCWVRFTDFLWRSERMQHESEAKYSMGVRSQFWGNRFLPSIIEARRSCQFRIGSFLVDQHGQAVESVI
jgi:hypothetical protein